MSWDSKAIKARMLEMIQSNYIFGVENNVKHGLYDLGCQPCGGIESQREGNCNNCEGGCGRSQKQQAWPEEEGSLSVLMGWDLDDPDMPVNLIEHVKQGYWGFTDDWDVANSQSIQALINKKLKKGDGKGKSRNGNKSLFQMF